MIERRLYQYVGPTDLMRLVQPDGGGVSVRSLAEFDEWASARTAEDLVEPFTFVINAAGVLRLAPRHSEHVVWSGTAHGTAG